MTIGLLLLLIYFLGATPGIIIGYLNDRKGVPQKANVTFSRPDGSRVQAQLDVTWSWTIFVFRGWSLAFRGQFMEWIITFIFAILLGSIVVLMQDSEGNLGSYGFGPFNMLIYGMGRETFPISELNWTTDTIVIFTIAFTGYLIWINYLVAFANKRRILLHMKKGMDFSTTPEYDKLLAYLGIAKRVPQSEMAPNMRAGKSHDYVVPDSVVEEQKAIEDDYSMLTVNDLKLLLKSEGVPYSTYDDKEKLLALVDEHIKEKKEETTSTTNVESKSDNLKKEEEK